MGDPVARSRWRILAKALSRGNSLEDPAEDELDSSTSVRRFSSYGLIATIPLVNLREPQATWFEYHTNISQDNFSVLVRHPKHSFTAADLMGFNNTGNVCVWPSEETLAFFCLSNRELFSGKAVIEIGGGMSCLAGLMVAKYTSAARVVLTDGNQIAMENVGRIVEKNGLKGLTHVTSEVLQWGKQSKLGRFDVILCADCLFFDEDRCDLVQTIDDLLAEEGVALMAAPQRGDTLGKFFEEANAAGLVCVLHKEYNQQVWQSHIHMQATEGSIYDEDIHYPLLLTVTKAGTPNDIHRIVAAGC